LSETDFSFRRWLPDRPTGLVGVSASCHGGRRPAFSGESIGRMLRQGTQLKRIGCDFAQACEMAEGRRKTGAIVDMTSPSRIIRDAQFSALEVASPRPWMLNSR
jgi:hypothetical protein